MRKSALLAFGLVVAFLVALGLVVLSTASEAKNVDPFFYMKRQSMYLVFGLVIGTAVALFDYRKWRDYKILSIGFYLVVFLLLLAVFGFKEINGSRRWIVLGPLSLQPSEFAKLAVVIAVAVWMDKIAWRVELFWKGAIYPSIIIGLIAAPVILEPDFGSTMVLVSAGFLVMFVAGTRLVHIAPLGLAGVAVICAILATNENRIRRLSKFFDSQQSNVVEMSSGSEVNNSTLENSTVKKKKQPIASEQAEHSLVAIHNGGIWGVGLGESMQKNHFLPEAHTDFVFAIGAEELGIFFSIIVIVLFLLFFLLSVYIARKAVDRFGRFIVIGMAYIIFFQAMFNLGVVCEALPTKGMALPFFSYGGTNLVTSFFAVGMILSVGIHSSRDRKRRLPSANK